MHLDSAGAQFRQGRGVTGRLPARNGTRLHPRRSRWTPTDSILPKTCRSFSPWRRRNRTRLAVGVRDFYAAGCPTHRRRSNAVSTFWFRAETGVRLGDTQCGFRGYPLALTQRLKTRAGRYAFELEFMVRAAWVGTPIVAVPVKCTYAPGKVGQSHFRPVRDLAHITTMNIGLVLQSWFVPQSLRVAWSRGEHKTFRVTVMKFSPIMRMIRCGCRWRSGWDCFSASCRSGDCKRCWR